MTRAGGSLKPEFLSAAEHALLGFSHRALGQADHGEGGHAVAGEIDLELDAVGVDAQEGGGGYVGEHVFSFRRLSGDSCCLYSRG